MAGKARSNYRCPAVPTYVHRHAIDRNRWFQLRSRPWPLHPTPPQSGIRVEAWMPPSSVAHHRPSMRPFRRHRQVSGNRRRPPARAYRPERQARTHRLNPRRPPAAPLPQRTPCQISRVKRGSVGRLFRRFQGDSVPVRGGRWRNCSPQRLTHRVGLHSHRRLANRVDPP